MIRALVRSGLRALLATSNDIQVVGEAVLRSVPWDLAATAETGGHDIHS